MIPRHQIVLFLVLLVTSAILGGVLWHLRERTHQQMLAGQASTPTQAPLVAPLEKAALIVAQDADDSLQTQVLSLPLPPDPGARAKAVLGKLLDLYAAPNATHPVPGGAASIAQVFLIPVTNGGKSEAVAGTADASSQSASPNASSDDQNIPELAVVNLASTFADNHPSGLETETLTVLSLCATLHANLPRVAQVRFLVDGEPRITLAGHADLTRTYLASDTLTTGGSPQ